MHRGKVKAKKVGRAVITVRTAKGTSANLSIRVKKAPAKIMLSARKKKGFEKRKNSNHCPQL